MNFSRFKELTRLEQSFFGLPMAFSGMLLAISDAKFEWEWKSILWAILAFFSARISGMAFNQWMDQEIDARNPRTQGRLLPTGRVSSHTAAWIAWGSLGTFLVCCLQLNLITALMAPFAAFLLFIYSYMKRIHASCHLVLGLIHFMAPLMAFSAVASHLSLSALFLGATAFCSVVASDIVYALQDYVFDCAEGLHSIPARFGKKMSRWIARFFHVGCAFFLALTGIFASFPWYAYLALVYPMSVWSYFHYQAKRGASSETSFFFTTVSSSLGVFAFILIGEVCLVLS